VTYEPTCAVCGHDVAPDTDHVRLEAEHVHVEDRNDVDEFYLHPRCARAVTGSWYDP
jgi:hypothetical protein